MCSQKLVCVTCRVQPQPPCQDGASTASPHCRLVQMGPVAVCWGLGSSPGSHQASVPRQPTQPRGAPGCLGQLCRAPASPFGLYPPTSTVLRAPCCSLSMRAGPSAAPLLYGATTWTLAMMALGVGRVGQRSIPILVPLPQGQ